jgi:2',3'-cyclic-nucleotide 2'-phosphodiesterase (5'-nucleotidase family)
VGLLLLDAGDVRTGAYCSDQQHSEPDFQFMEAMGYDAMTVGNHEFDVVFDHLVTQSKRVSFPFLSANIRLTQGELLFPSHALFDRQGLRIAVIGLTPPETASISTRGGDSRVRFEDPFPALGRLVDELRGHVQVLVVLSHLGLEQDRRMAAQVPGIDVILGGHSHHALRSPQRVEGTIIAHAGSNGRYVGRLELDVRPSGVDLVSGGLEEVGPDLAVDPTVAQIMARYHCTGGRAPVATLAEPITREKLDGPGSSSPLSNLVSDAYRAIGEADVALVNRGGLRSDLPAGRLTEREVHSVLPFENTLVVLEATGAVLQRIAESIHGRGPEGRGYLFPSGMEFFFGPGDQVRVVVDGQEVAPEQPLTLAVSSFIVGGGDRYSFLQALPVARRVDELTSAVLARYLRQNRLLSIDRRNRVHWQGLSGLHAVDGTAPTTGAGTPQGQGAPLF